VLNRYDLEEKVVRKHLSVKVQCHHTMRPSPDDLLSYIEIGTPVTPALCDIYVDFAFLYFFVFELGAST